ncbi:MAG: DNRLRE domain-containing protein [Bacteroidota bacterium]
MRTITVFSLLLLFLSACQNDPDPTGIGLIPNEDLTAAFQTDSQRDSTSLRDAVYPFTMTHGTSTILSIGEADGFSSKALLRWLYLPDSIAYGGRIVSATIRLRSLPYHIGDASASYRLEAREITSFWNSYTMTVDSLGANGLQHEANPAGVFEGSFGEADSIDLALDSTLVRKWFVNTHENKATENYGVLLESPSSGIMRSFNALDAGGINAPRLIVVVETAFGLDTLYGETADDTYLTTSTLQEPVERIVLQGGGSVRGKLYFDVSAIPPASIINHAVLYLTMDPSLSTEYYRGADTVLVYQSVDSTKNILNASGLISRTDNAQPGVLITEGAPFTRAVQDWVNGKGNYGLILVAMNENTDLDRMALYGAAAAADKRPRLVVTYTSQP